MSWCSSFCLLLQLAVMICVTFRNTDAVRSEATSIIGTGGIRGQVHFFPYTYIDFVLVSLDDLQPSISGLDFEVHEFGVDYSLAPSVRCRSEHVGPLISFGQRSGNSISTTIRDLLLHSVVLVASGEIISCGTIVPFSLPDFAAIVRFKANIFGWIYVLQWPDRIHVFGKLLGKMDNVSDLDSGNQLIRNVTVVIHENALGAYATLEDDCAHLGSQTDILVNSITVATSLDSLPNALFARLYAGASNDLLPDSVLHGISIQDSSGQVLTCGRLDTLIAVDVAYKGKGVLNQFMPFLHTGVSDPSDTELLQYNIVESIQGTCSSNDTIFNPWMAPEMQQEGVSLDLIPVGNLPNHEIEFFTVLPEVPLIGSASIIGHTVNDSECNSLDLYVAPGKGYTIKGYAVFSGPILTGRIALTQVVYFPDWVLGPTVISVNLSYAHEVEVTMNHSWFIHTARVGSNGTICDPGYDVYNPYAVNRSKASGYLADCTALTQLRCAMGDLSGKLGALQLEPVTTRPRKTYSFYDENLHLLGPFTVIGRSIVVYGTGAQSGQLLGCANIEPSLVAEEEIEISFPRNGTNPDDIDREGMGHFLSTLAGVPLGDVLVSDVQAVNISGHDCLTASLWITGVDANNASLNAVNVSALDRQNLNQYSAGPCVPPPNVTESTPGSQTITTDSSIIIIAVLVTAFILLSFIIGALLIVAARRKKNPAAEMMFVYRVEGQEGTREFSTALAKLLPSKGDQWELRGSHFEVGTELGEGNYGHVYKGTLSMDVATAPAKRYIATQTRDGKPPYSVAIKLLKGGADERFVENFLEEIAMMKKVSTGECSHVVQMVGCVSTALPLALALEFVPFGDLLSYLKYWKQKLTVNAKERLPHHDGLPLPGYDRLLPVKDVQEGLYVNATEDSCKENKVSVDPEEKLSSIAAKPQEGMEVGAEVLCLAASLDKDSEEGMNLESTREQELLSSPLGEPDAEMCTVYTNTQCTLKLEDSQSPLSAPTSCGYDKLYPIESTEEDLSSAAARYQESQYGGEKVLYSDTINNQEMFYSPLGEPKLADLLSFAHQITQGMEYLSSLGILHRDLACRNILVDERKLLKISDFGLSRDTPEYVSSLKDKMPLRWMAPETVTENVFTDKSDVWAFGVCLWEMYTLGELPYRDIPLATIVARIVSGYRLPKPEHVPDQVYELMQSCWRSEPHARLNFTQLKYSFKNMIFANNPMTSYVSIKPNVSSTTVSRNAPVRRSSQESNKEGQYERISAVNRVPT